MLCLRLFLSLEKCVNIQNQKLKMLTYRSIDLEARSWRNNLVFRGLADCNYENCKDVIVDFLSCELKIDISQALLLELIGQGHWQDPERNIQSPEDQ